ncbi:MAG: DMT family transporter [Pseudomonadota bacterium]
MSNSVIYAAVMLAAGLGIPTMAAISGGLSGRLGSPVLATTVLLLVALSITVATLLLTGGLRVPVPISSIPWYFFTGGAFAAFYMLGITWVAPQFGVANAVAFVLLGQLIAMTIIDHVGFVGAPQSSVTWPRFFGLVLMTAGVILVVNPRLE